MKFWASLNFSQPEFEFLIIRRQTFLIPLTQDICDVYSAREAEFSKPETQERQVIKGGDWDLPKQGTYPTVEVNTILKGTPALD